MSWQMTNAVRATALELRDALPTIEKHRPSVAAAAVVARELADRFQDERGYVNESVDQLVDATGLSSGQVRDALVALDRLGFWVADGKGNQHRPTVRRPGEVLLAALHRGTPRDADHGASRPHPRSTAPSNTAQPAMLDQDPDRASRDTPGASRADTPSIAGQPATPRSPRSSPRVSSSSTGSDAWDDEPAASDQPPPPPEPETPTPARGSLIWANWLARSAGEDCSLPLAKRRAWIQHHHHEHPDLTDDELVAELRKWHPAAGNPPPPPRLAPAAQAALDALEAHG